MDFELTPGSNIEVKEKEEIKNPQAFPCIDTDYLQEGMTLRDYMAAKAMPHIQRSYWDGRGIDYEMVGGDADNIAEQSYLLADAMLKARNGK